MLPPRFMLMETSRILLPRVAKGLRVGDLSLDRWGSRAVQRGTTVCKLPMQPAAKPGLEPCSLILSLLVHHVTWVSLYLPKCGP